VALGHTPDYPVLPRYPKVLAMRGPAPELRLDGEEGNALFRACQGDAARQQKRYAALPRKRLRLPPLSAETEVLS